MGVPDIGVLNMSSNSGGSMVYILTGLLSPAWMLWRFERRIRRAGFRVSTISYGHLRQRAAVSAEDFGRRLDAVEGEDVDLVVHSFGGLVLLHLFEQSSPERLAKIRSIVFLGSPLTGSAVTRHLLQSRLGRFWRWFFGTALDRGLAGNQPPFEPPPVECVMVAGTGNAMFARLIWSETEPGDGLVSVAEAQPKNAAANTSEHILDLGHAELIYRSEAIDFVVKHLQRSA